MPSTTDRPAPRVVAALVAVQLFFGLHYPAAKELLRWIDPAAWALLRIAAAAALLHLVARGRREGAPSVREWLHLGSFALFGVVLNQILFLEGLARTTPAHSALINTTIPMWAVLFALVLGRERLSLNRGAGLLLALAGAGVLLRADRFRGDADLLPGDLLTLANSASFALFLVLSRDYLRQHDPLAAVARVFALGTIGVAIYGTPALLRVDPSDFSPRLLGLAAFIVVFPTVGAYLLNYWALRRTASSVVALFVYLQPLIAATVQAILGQGLPGPRYFVAAAMVFAGVGLGALGPGQPGRRADG